MLNQDQHALPIGNREDTPFEAMVVREKSRPYEEEKRQRNASQFGKDHNMKQPATDSYAILMEEIKEQFRSGEETPSQIQEKSSTRLLKGTKGRMSK